MSTSKMVTVWCDAPDCPEWIAQEDTAGEARAVAKKARWSYRVGHPTTGPGRDLCPKHTEEARRG